MLDFFLNEINLMILITAIVFTAFGWFMAKRQFVSDVIASTIDSLIDDGYLKTIGHGADMQILKWRDWCDENSNSSSS